MVRIKYSDGLWKPADISDKHDIRSHTVQTPSGGSYRRTRRHLLKTGEKNDINQNPVSDIPNVLSSGAAVTDDTNLVSATPLSPVKSPPKPSKSASTTVSSQTYITRFGRVCKSKIKESM